MLAANCDDAVGQGFLITDGEAITRREMVETVCEEMGYEKPAGSIPRGLAKVLCPVVEAAARVANAKKAPRLNRFRYKFAATHLTFDISKARRVLGYEPKHATGEALRATAGWLKDNQPELLSRE